MEVPQKKSQKQSYHIIQQEKAMAPHSSTLAWKIPWTKEPGRLQTMGLRRVRHDRVTSLSLFPFMHQRRKWQPTPVFLPGGSQGRGSLVGRRLWGHTESDTTEVIQQQQHDPAIPIRGTHPDETIIQKDTCTPIFIGALFPITKTYKQLNVPQRLNG